jgi:hypothetical protein
MLQFYFVFSGLKIIGHGNPDNNLESSWTYADIRAGNWDYTHHKTEAQQFSTTILNI